MEKTIIALASAVLLSASGLVAPIYAQVTATPESWLITNGDFQTDANTDNTPDGWSAAQGSLSYSIKGDNRFLHLAVEKPGQMVVAYRQIPIPEGVKALELTWKQRVTDLKPGSESWFDARIMMEWKDAQGNRIKGAPSAPYARKDTHGWETKSKLFLVPQGARLLEFMPALFRVQSGSFDLDDIALKPTDPVPIEAAERERSLANAQKTALRDEKINQSLAANGSFVLNGNFETDANGDGVPDKWSQPKESISYQTEGNNHFLRLTSSEKFKMVLSYHLVFLPSTVKAIEIKWKQRVNNLKVGEQNFHDARIMTDFTDNTGHKTHSGPTLSAMKKNSAGWEEKSHSFLVSAKTGGLAFMPTLFKVEQGTFDLDDVSIKAIDPTLVLVTAAKAVENNEP